MFCLVLAFAVLFGSQVQCAQQSFKLTTRTSTEINAGSDPGPKVFIKVYDITNQKWSEEKMLDDPAKNDFEIGATDVFNFNVTTDTGTEDNKWIGLKNLSEDGWNVQSITLEDVVAKKTWNYGSNIWLDSPHAPNVLLSPLSTQQMRCG